MRTGCICPECGANFTLGERCECEKSAPLPLRGKGSFVYTEEFKRMKAALIRDLKKEEILS